MAGGTMTLKQVALNLVAVLMVMGITSVAHGQGSAQVKSDSLKYLQDLRSQNVRRMQEIDQSISRKFEESAPAQIETEITTLKTAKKEHVMRQEFLDRLIFQIDTKFIGGDLKAFLERSLVDMAKIDAANSAAETGIWKFMKYASDAIRRLPEQKENILSFLEGYMNRSVVNPVKPEEYISSRNYTNGATSEAGRPVSREDVGAIADRRIREQEQTSKLPVLPAPQQQKIQ
jgi:hypothetical protein